MGFHQGRCQAQHPAVLKQYSCYVSYTSASETGLLSAHKMHLNTVPLQINRLLADTFVFGICSVCCQWSIMQEGI